MNYSNDDMTNQCFNIRKNPLKLNIREKQKIYAIYDLCFLEYLYFYQARMPV